LVEVSLEDYKNLKGHSYFAIFLAEKKLVKIMQNKETKKIVFVKDTGGFTEEEEEQWLE